jgi:hypothetical protein
MTVASVKRPAGIWCCKGRIEGLEVEGQFQDARYGLPRRSGLSQNLQYERPRSAPGAPQRALTVTWKGDSNGRGTPTRGGAGAQ